MCKLYVYRFATHRYYPKNENQNLPFPSSISFIIVDGAPEKKVRRCEEEKVFGYVFVCDIGGGGGLVVQDDDYGFLGIPTSFISSENPFCLIFSWSFYISSTCNRNDPFFLFLSICRAISFLNFVVVINPKDSATRGHLCVQYIFRILMPSHDNPFFYTAIFYFFVMLPFVFALTSNLPFVFGKFCSVNI